jgi:hypothetical protein
VPTRSSIGFPQYETLSHGKHIWGRLAENEKSFTVEFHDSYAVISFNVPQNINEITCAALWVRVRLLNLAEQSRLKSESENVVALETIREGVEEVVKNVRNDLQTSFYIWWEQQMISVKFSSVGPFGNESTSGSKMDQ